MLPNGFQPRPCQFCGSRSIQNSRASAEEFKVTCLFCRAFFQIMARSNDEAWLFWNGQGEKSPLSKSTIKTEHRSCVFCDSVDIFNDASRVLCFSCGAHGPEGAKSFEEAWRDWDGLGRKASPMFGGMHEVTL